MTAPFVQADPVAVEAQARQRVEQFLAARISGQDAEGYVSVQETDADVGVPLLYATTSGASYDRYEFERVGRPRWPDGNVTFSARLFADDGTVVEQEIDWWGALWLDPMSTTENGQPIALQRASGDGEVTASVPSTWDAFWPGRAGGDFTAPDVWFGLLAPGSFDSREHIGEHIGFVDPVAYDAWCAAKGGSSLLSAPADAAGIAQQVIADPNFEATAPTAARIGGLDAVSMDVSLAPDGEACAMAITDISRWIHSLETQPGSRVRLYLVDLPEDMAVETLAITVVAPEERFEQFIEETAPIIESIEFHVP